MTFRGYRSMVDNALSGPYQPPVTRYYSGQSFENTVSQSSLPASFEFSGSVSDGSVSMPGVASDNKVFAILWSGGGEKVFYSYRDGNFDPVLAEASVGTPYSLLDGIEQIQTVSPPSSLSDTDAAWSASGNRLFFHHLGGVQSYTVNDPYTLNGFSLEYEAELNVSNEPDCLEFASGGERIIVGTPNERVVESELSAPFDLSNPTFVGEFTTPQDVSRLYWGADGESLYVGQSDYEVYEVNEPFTITQGVTQVGTISGPTSIFPNVRTFQI